MTDKNNAERNTNQNGSGESISFTVVKHIGVLSTSNNGWSKEVNLVTWNGGKPKYDIRDWSPDHEKMTKGLRITAYEAKQLRAILDKLDLEQPLPGLEENSDGDPASVDPAVGNMDGQGTEETEDAVETSPASEEQDKNEGVPF